MFFPLKSVNRTVLKRVPFLDFFIEGASRTEPKNAQFSVFTCNKMENCVYTVTVGLTLLNKKTGIIIYYLV